MKKFIFAVMLLALPLFAIAQQPLMPISMGASVEGTAGSATGTTAVALPQTGLRKQIHISNLSSTQVLYVKLSASNSGPDASDNTTGGQRVPLPPYSVQVFTIRGNDAYAYFYSSANCAYSFMVGEGN